MNSKDTEYHIKEIIKRAGNLDFNTWYGNEDDPDHEKSYNKDYYNFISNLLSRKDQEYLFVQILAIIYYKLYIYQDDEDKFRQSKVDWLNIDEDTKRPFINMAQLAFTSLIYHPSENYKIYDAIFRLWMTYVRCKISNLG